MSNLPAERARCKRPNGVILYEGPSQIDGKPIVVIATGLGRRTANAKTGDMIQTWILRAHVSATRAINTGADASICGACPLRGVLERQPDGSTKNRLRACYVSVRNAPRAVYEAYTRGKYPRFDPRQHLCLFRGRMLRLGSYGDPVAVPYSVWTPLVKVAAGRTGYTHQWHVRRFWRFRYLAMASVETHEQAQLARARGWRTFRTSAPGELPGPGEISCPASAEQGKRLTCEQCGACNGSNGRPQRASVMIWAHGSPATLGSYKRLLGDS
jgi:hypothetical protein